MKKLLGLLALTLAVSGIASADQDVLKSIKATTELRQGWTDKDGAKANEIGNAGFKKRNKTRLRWRNVVSGELNLVDEWGLDAKFKVQNDKDRFYKYATNGENLDSAKREGGWETNLEFGKALNIGSLETRTVLGWTHKSSYAGSKQTHKETNGQSNEFYFGPTFGVNVLGQSISTKLQAVYFNNNGKKDADYVYKGNAFQRGKTEGWGLNFDLATEGKFFENGAGSLGYYVELNNHMRDGKGKLVATGKEAKSSVYLDYIVGATYTTPSFAGFYGQLNLENEWERHTAESGYVNNFSVWTNLGYKTSFDTPVGEISINPFIKYRPLHRETEQNKHGGVNPNKADDKRHTTETNEFRAGLGVGLTVK